MRNLKHLVATGLLAVVLSAMMSSSDLVGKAWSQAFGMIAATIERADDSRGLTIRSAPSESAGAVGYLPVGAEIRACNDFKGTWARLQSPSPGGWVNMVNLKPKGGQGSVVAVDGSDQCLAIRKGPSNSYERVGCARLGQELKLSGVWSENNFARLDSGDWVDASNISTDLMTCDTSSPPQAAEVPLPDYQEPSPTYAPSYAASNTYAPSYNFGTFGVPYLFGPNYAFGFYPGWWPGPVAVAIWNAYPWRYWRRPYYHPHPVPYAHNRAKMNPNLSMAAVNRRAVNANRAIVSPNRTNNNNFRARNDGNVTNYRSRNAAWNRGSSNYSVRRGSFNGGLSASRATATWFRGNSVQARNFARSSLRGTSFRSGGGHGAGRRR